MDKCITCLPNGTETQRELIKHYKENNISRMVFRTKESEQWQICDIESFKFYKNKHIKLKTFQYFHVQEFKE